MAKEKSAKLEAFTSGIWKNNPLFAMLLGLCPALAVTTSLEASLGMGILFTIVLVCSNVIISAIKKIVPDEVRTPVYIVVIATFVTIVKMFTNAFLPDLYATLGVFLSLIVVNCIVLGRAEAYASKNGVVESLLDGLGNGIGYTIAICIIGLVREVLGNGTLVFGQVLTFLPYAKIYLLRNVSGTVDFSMSLFGTPTGAFIVLGMILAIIAAAKNSKAAKEKALAKLKAQAEKAQAQGGSK